MSERSDAIAAGLSHYSTGRPCVRGHVARRHVSGGCTECRRTYTREYKRERRRKSTAALQALIQSRRRGEP